jgi:hypothetical protein
MSFFFNEETKMSIPLNGDGNPVTKASLEDFRLAQAIGAHPDVLVEARCPVSRQLRAGQEARQKRAS